MRRLGRGVLGAALTAGLMAGGAWAKVVDFRIVETISPAFDGTAFGEGAYERIDAIAEFAIDPKSERGQRIVDLDKAPVDAAGMVRFSTEVTILRPVDAPKGSGMLFYDVPNRGRNLAFMLMNLSSGAGIPKAAEDAGDGYLMAEGYTIVWSGWQTGLPDELLNLTLPVLPEVTGLSREEFVFDKPGAASEAALSYPAADLDPAKATLTVRQRATDPRATPAGLGFRYLSPTAIEITRPEGFDAGAIYEFIYPAKDAVPAGLAFVATSDLISFLRGSPGHDAESPLAGITHTVGLGISQSGRFLRDLIYQGFNADEAGARVFDGAIPHIAGSRKTFTNYRFAQPGRYSRQHEDHDFPGDQFPFTYAEATDPVTGRAESILSACRATDTCPKIMHTDTSTEFWQARASLVSTSPAGEPLTMPEDVRLYYIAGAPHFGPWSAKSGATETCRFPSNPVSSAPVMRALLAAMRDWVQADKAPPASRYPSLADGTLVTLADLKLPSLPEGELVPPFNELKAQDYGSLPPKAGA
ncbi:MAG TPA: alpha/beta hydrolase domain-containing protein, partial [Paracoccaceae bacterium]|nr:alpha/beta hydrolase domain-containing protein [Paracoccaceae bacterium]